MFTLIKNAVVYSPLFEGQKDILIAFGRIAEVGEKLEYSSLPGLNIIDADGLTAFPGLVDLHVHMTGGGGEGGFGTRTAEIDASGLLNNGITTAVGVLGTDGITRSLEGLYAKARALESGGVSTYMYTGSYQLPVLTLTGSIQRDIVLIDKVIGVGEIAIADHRSFYPTAGELARIAAEARVGGMLSGKSGIVHLHLGDHPDGLGLMQRVLAKSAIPVSQFLPTHVNRNPELFGQALKHAETGGLIDLTAGFYPEDETDGCIPAFEAAARIIDSGVDIANVTMSSDGNGSIPVFGAEGKLLRIDAASCGVLLDDMRKAVLGCGIPLEKALSMVTSNPARVLKIDSDKGSLIAGRHADIVLADDRLDIKLVIAKGNIAYRSCQTPG